MSFGHAAPQIRLALVLGVSQVLCGCPQLLEDDFVKVTRNPEPATHGGDAGDSGGDATSSSGSGGTDAPGVAGASDGNLGRAGSSVATGGMWDVGGSPALGVGGSQVLGGSAGASSGGSPDSGSGGTTSSLAGTGGWLVTGGTGDPGGVAGSGGSGDIGGWTASGGRGEAGGVAGTDGHGPLGGWTAQESGGSTSSGGVASTGGVAETGGGTQTGGSTGTGGDTESGGAAGSAGSGASGGGAGVDCEFRAAERIVIPNLTGNAWGSTLSADGLTLYFSADTNGSNEIWRATRADRGATFSEAQAVSFSDFTGETRVPFLSFDGNRLYFTRDSSESGLDTGYDLVVAEQTTGPTRFGVPSAVGGVNSADDDRRAWLSDDELRIVFVSDRTEGEGDDDLWEAVRDTPSEDFANIVNLPRINTPSSEDSPTLSPDGLTLYFVSDRVAPGAVGGKDIYRASRQDPDGAFGDVVNLTVLNSAQTEADLALSHDGQELFFSSKRNSAADATAEIWRSVWECL